MTRRKERTALYDALDTAKAIQRDVDLILAPTTTRRPPRQLDGKRVVKIRITADCEADAEEARAIIEHVLATHQARMQTPREGSNPKYIDAQKWMSYGDFTLSGKRRKQ